MSKGQRGLLARSERLAILALAVLLAPLALLVTLELAALSGLLDRLAHREPPVRRVTSDRRGHQEPPEASDHPATSEPPAHQDRPALRVIRDQWGELGLADRGEPLERQEYPDPWEIQARRASPDHPVFRER